MSAIQLTIETKQSNIDQINTVVQQRIANTAEHANRLNNCWYLNTRSRIYTEYFEIQGLAFEPKFLVESAKRHIRTPKCVKQIVWCKRHERHEKNMLELCRERPRAFSVIYRSKRL